MMAVPLLSYDATQVKTCIVCGATFQRNPKFSENQWVKAQRCSFRCGAATRRGSRIAPPSTVTPVERFFAKIRFAPSTGCWEWTAGRSSYGYGTFRIDNDETIKAHIYSWMLHNGEIPDHDSYHGLCVCHHCDNPPCVNPGHLFLGTSADNAADMIAKGRKYVAYGERHHAAKLTIEDAEQIRVEMGSSRASDLASRYGVSRTAIYQVWKNRTWTSQRKDMIDA